jgi:hypothetical protein
MTSWTMWAVIHEILDVRRHLVNLTHVGGIFDGNGEVRVDRVILPQVLNIDALGIYDGEPRFEARVEASGPSGGDTGRRFQKVTHVAHTKTSTSTSLPS